MQFDLIQTFQALSLVGSRLADLYQDTETGLRFRELSIDAKWGIRLGELGVSIHNALIFNLS